MNAYKGLFLTYSCLFKFINMSEIFRNSKQAMENVLRMEK